MSELERIEREAKERRERWEGDGFYSHDCHGAEAAVDELIATVKELEHIRSEYRRDLDATGLVIKQRDEAREMYREEHNRHTMTTTALHEARTLADQLAALLDRRYFAPKTGYEEMYERRKDAYEKRSWKPRTNEHAGSFHHMPGCNSIGCLGCAE